MKKAMDSFKSIVSGLLMIFFIGAIGFGSGWYVCRLQQPQKEIVSDIDEKRKFGIL